MIRSDIVARFREEMPEATSRVVSDAVLYSWLELADKSFCAETRCIVDQGTTITTTSGEQYWDLNTKITNFYDIDMRATSGVTYNGKALTYKSMAELDFETPNWRSKTAGIPKYWFRRGKYLWVDRKVDSAADDIVVYASLISDDWNADVTPYNSLPELEPYHEAMLLNIIYRAKAKIAKPEEALAALQMYKSYVAWAISQLGGTRCGTVFFRKKI